MKKKLSNLFCLPLLFFFIAQAQAFHSLTTNTFTVSKNTVLESEQWVQCENATIAGHLKNDLFIFANQNVIINGTVDGAIWGIGTQILFSGTANQNTRFGGETVHISGILNGTLLAIANTVQITTNAQVHGELNIVGKKVFIEGLIDGPASIQAGELVTLTGTIKGNVQITAPKIIIQNQTRIEGNLTYISPNELILDKSIVKGKLIRKTTPTFSSKDLFAIFLSTLVTGIFLISIFPITFAISTQTIREAPWRCLWTGALVVLLLFMLASMTIQTLLGRPIGLFLFASWGFLIYTSQIVVALVLGSLLLRRQNRSLKQVLSSLLTGLLFLYLLPLLPGLALFVFIATTSIGTGALFLAILQQRRLVVQLPEEPQSYINQEPNFNKNKMEENNE